MFRLYYGLHQLLQLKILMHEITSKNALFARLCQLHVYSVYRRQYGQVVRALILQPSGPGSDPRSGHRNCIRLGLGLDKIQFLDHALQIANWFVS